MRRKDWVQSRVGVTVRAKEAGDPCPPLLASSSTTFRLKQRDEVMCADFGLVIGHRETDRLVWELTTQCLDALSLSVCPSCHCAYATLLTARDPGLESIPVFQITS